MIDGLSVYDAHERREVICNNRLLIAINDLRAMHHVSMATQAPALHWACRDCNVLGVYVKLLDTVVYIGAIRLLPGCGSTRVRRLQREWRARFHGTPDLLALEDRPIFKRDAKFNYDAGVVADQARVISKAAHERAVNAGGFHGLGTCHVLHDDYASMCTCLLMCTWMTMPYVDDDYASYIFNADCFSGSRCGWDVGRQNKEDQMHQVANCVKMIFCLGLDRGKMGRFSEKRRKCEVQLERFPELMCYDAKQPSG